MTAPNNQPLSKEDYQRFRSYVKQNPRTFHIVLEDYNVKNNHVEFCKGLAEKADDAEGIALADILLGLSKSQRLKLAKKLY